MGDFNSDPRSNNSDAEFLTNFASENSLFSKSAFSVIGPYIEQILNSSIRESIFPSVWKKSLVLALNKIAVPKTMSDTRPIVLLFFFCRRSLSGLFMDRYLITLRLGSY